MKLLFRISIALYSLFSMVFWFFTILVMIFRKNFTDRALASMAREFDFNFLSTTGAWFIIIFICIGCLLFNLYIFLSGIQGGKEKRCISKETSIGEIRISPTTFENIAINVIRRLNGIRDARAFIHIKDNEVRLTIRAVFLSDVNIPALSEEAQTRIKQAVETCTGVIVKEVRVLVDSVYTVYKGRVE